MARPSTPARRYAEAAFEIARRDGTLERWLDDLRLAADVVTQPDAARVVDNPAIPFAMRREVLGKLLEQRRAAYRALPHHVDTTGLTLDEVVERVVELYERAALSCHT